MRCKPSSWIYHLDGPQPVDVLIKTSARAKRFSLRVSNLDGTVSLTMPNWAPEREALDFLQSRRAWLAGHLQNRPALQRPAIGGVIPIAGQPHEICKSPETTGSRAAHIVDGRLYVADDARLPVRVATLLKAMAQCELRAASEKYAARLGRSFSKLSLRDTKSRWGSCSAQGHLMYSWRLIMAPPAVLDYVAAHEVAHLVEMNHGPKFWAHCAALCPDYQTHRKWLKTHGREILAWRFVSLPKDDIL
ncbi:M48 family metallopeptidase [Rhodobacteraceae bacterium XHP0102]|nr:M48 family metallopeptidase [Rhodobacteraceae bacterium XHP0102]